MSLLRARPEAECPGQDRELSGQGCHGAQVDLIMRIPVALQCPEKSFPPFL